MARRSNTKHLKAAQAEWYSLRKKPPASYGAEGLKLWIKILDRHLPPPPDPRDYYRGPERKLVDHHRTVTPEPHAYTAPRNL